MGAKIIGLEVYSTDEFVLVDEFCEPDDKIWVNGSARQCGGVVANFCVGVARAGELELTNETDVARVAKKLLALGLGLVLITPGENGCLLVIEKKEVRVPIYRVEKVVDTTGAGDPFNSAFVSSIHKGILPKEAFDFASAAAALSVTKIGAQSTLFWKKVEEFIASKPPRGK